MSCRWTAAKGLLHDETKVEKNYVLCAASFCTIFHPTHYP